MSALGRLGRLFWSLIHRRRLERELDEEMAAHRAMLDEPRRFGNRLRLREEAADVWGWTWLDDFGRDLAYGARTVRRAPGFAATAVLVLALGIGANTAVFSVVRDVVLRPLPFPGADRLVTVSTFVPSTGTINPLVADPNFLDWRDRNTSFEAMATYRGGNEAVMVGEAAEYGRVSIVDEQFFAVLGVQPALGRLFTADDFAWATEVAVVSHTFWQTRLGSDADVLARTVRVDGDPTRIVGVLPPGFDFRGGTEIWLPASLRSDSRNRHYQFAVGRLHPGVRMAQAQAELTGIAAALEQQYPDSNRDRSVRILPLQELLVGDLRPTLLLLWSVVGVVLLIACVNTAALLLSRATARTREVTVRRALGASRHRIVRQLLAESLLLALLAGALGALVARWGIGALVALSPADAVRAAAPSLDGGVLTFTMVASLATSVAFGLAPALFASRATPADAFRGDGDRSSSAGRMSRARGTLVVAQVALAVLLLTGAGLLVRTLMALNAVDLGFEPANVLVMRATGTRSQAENAAFFTETLDRIRALPGVVAAGATSIPPGDLSLFASGSYLIDRIPEPRDRLREPEALLTIVAPDTFAALGVRVTRGREFEARDTADAPLVAVVNEALARNAFGDESPIGRTIFCSFDRDDGMTIVGVVSDVRQRNPATAPDAECYMPYTQHDYNGSTLNVVVRAESDLQTLAASIRQVAAAVEPTVPVSFTTMDATVTGSLALHRFRTLLLGLFAGFAACLAVVGVYGVIAHTVVRRTREIGIRMALGAKRGAVLGLVLRQSAALTGIGIATGLLAAVGLTRYLSGMLFELTPLDPITFGLAGLTFAGLAAAATLGPARRATRVDPMTALRCE